MRRGSSTTYSGSRPKNEMRRATSGARLRDKTLTPAAAFVLLATAFGSLAFSSTVPTPLYSVYAARWGFSAATVTIVFAVYTVAVLATLLTLGRLSDHVGRRPVIVVSLSVQALGALLFITASGVPELMLARVAQGVGVGVGTPALAAALLDLHPERGAVASAIAPLVGTAAGSLLSGIFVQYLPWRTTLVYLVLAAMLVAESVGLLFIEETSPRAPGGRRSLRPRLALPLATRGAVLVVAPLLVAIWTLFGFYGSLGPALLYRISGSSSIAVGGLTLFVFAGAAAVMTLVLRRMAPEQVMSIASGALIIGVALCLVSVGTGSVVLFLVAALVSGVGFGAGLQGAFRSVLPRAAPQERGGLASTLYVIMYLAFGLPTVAAGFLVVHGGGLRSTAEIDGAVLIGLGGLALLGMLSRRQRTPTSDP